MSTYEYNSQLMAQRLPQAPNYAFRDIDRAPLQYAYPLFKAPEDVAADKEIGMYMIQPRKAVVPDHCVLHFTALGAARTLSLGYDAYDVPADGGLTTTVPKDAEAFVTNADASAAGKASFIITKPQYFAGLAPLILTIKGGTFPTDAEAWLTLVYTSYATA